MEVEMMADLIRDFWGVIIGALAAVIWLVRLESRGISNAAEVRRLWAQRKEDMDVQREQRGEANKMIAEIRSDIKDVLKRLGQ